ncbi:MAG: hypothetical protein R2909_09785 [Gemmatimonadales bacterium]
MTRPASVSLPPSPRITLLFVTLVATGSGPILAQAPTRDGTRRLLDRAEEVALARSAAPTSVSAKARVWVFTGKTYVVADSGETEASCYVGRPWSGSLEPHCFDPEGSATILPIQIRRVELYVEGKSDDEAEREIADGIRSGRFRLPRRDAVTYMMSAAQELITQTGTPIGAWKPHLMIYRPYVTPGDIGLGEGGSATVFIENPGQALAALIVPVPDFVPAPKSPSR